MEIKFFDVDKKKYSDKEFLFLGSDGKTYSHDQSTWVCYMREHKNVEPHFYLNGKRVA